MDILKFEKECDTLKKFFEIYCLCNHNLQLNHKKIIPYKKQKFEYTLHLCCECYEKINYSFDKLLECPHENKPKCRKCKNPCYDKKEWKETAKIMRFSGFKLGLLSIKKFFKSGQRGS